MEFDISIKNGSIIDGTGNPWFNGDLGIKKGKIVKIGRLDPSSSLKTINAEDMFICPGFIDAHSHSDVSILLNPRVESTMRQGITTLVTGNCGISLAPVNKDLKDLLRKNISPFIPTGAELDVDWTTFDEYLRREEKTGVASNITHLVGHGTVRIAVMGFADRAPTPIELDDMKSLVIEAMEAGAIGLSTGLIYSPGIYSKTAELLELAKVVSEYRGVYASHIRGEGGTLLDALREAIEIGEEARVSVQVSHHKAAGRRYWGSTGKTLRLMEEARDRNVDVAFDQYPYKAGMTSLATLLPPWAHEGGLERLLERLRNTAERDRIRIDMERGVVGWQNMLADCGWENIVVSSVKTEMNRHLEGKNLAEITRVKDKPDEYAALFDLLIEEEGAATMIIFSMSENDIRKVMKHPLQMIGSDSWSVSPSRQTGIGKPHPRFYGTFPRILGRYVREEGVLRLEEAVRKMTSFPAQRFMLRGRGVISEGFWADIVIFDRDKIIDKATYEDPHQFPEGIEYVLVNGEVVVETGNHTGILAGKILRLN